MPHVLVLFVVEESTNQDQVQCLPAKMLVNLLTFVISIITTWPHLLRVFFSFLFFLFQLLGAAFLAIGLWAWAEKVRTQATRSHNLTAQRPGDCYNNIPGIPRRIARRNPGWS